MGWVYLPPTPLHWTPSSTLRPKPRGPAPKPRSPNTFLAKPCQNLAPQDGPSRLLWAPLGNWCLGFEVLGLGFEVLGLGSTVLGLGFEALALKPRSPAFHKTLWADRPQTSKPSPRSLERSPQTVEPRLQILNTSLLEPSWSHLLAKARKCLKLMFRELPGTIWRPRTENAEHEPSGYPLRTFGDHRTKMLETSILGIRWPKTKIE